MSSAARVIVGIASLLAGACSSTLPLPPPERASARSTEPLRTPREEVDPATGTVLHSWSEIVEPDGRVVKHGLEREWYPDGTPKSERSFDHGNGTGQWRTWYQGGAVSYEYRFGAPDEPTTMRFLHEDGSLQAEGPAIGGVKTGAWTYWHANGVVKSRGDYESGRREGAWSFWREDGSLAARGSMHLDARIGEWELAEPSPVAR